MVLGCCFVCDYGIVFNSEKAVRNPPREVKNCCAGGEQFDGKDFPEAGAIPQIKDDIEDASVKAIDQFAVIVWRRLKVHSTNDTSSGSRVKILAPYQREPEAHELVPLKRLEKIPTLVNKAFRGDDKTAR